MPVSKKRKKDEKKKRREREGQGQAQAAPPSAPVEPVGGGGLLTRMRGGFQNVAGTGPKKRESPISKILTWVLVAVAAYFLARRFGLIP